MTQNNRFELLSLAIRFERLADGGCKVQLREEEYHSLANYYDHRCQTELALTVLEHAVAFHPFTADFLLREAELLIDLQLEEQALQTLDRAEKLAPDSLRVGLLRSDALARIGLYEDALAILDELKDTYRPEEKSDIYYYEAKVLECRGGRYTEAAFKCLQNAILFNENNDAAFERLFNLRYMGRWVECYQLFRRKTDDNPYHAPSWYALGEIYAAEYDRTAAIECFENAYLSDSKMTRAYLRAAEEWRNTGQPREALKCYSDVAAEVRQDLEALINIGRCHIDLGEYGPALQTLRHTYRAVFHQDEQTGEILGLLGHCYVKTNRHQTALGYFQEAVRHDTQNEDHHVAMARILAHLGKIKNAQRAYTTAVELAPERNEIWYELILFQQQQGLLDGALDSLDMGNLNVGNVEFRVIEAIVWFREREIERSLDILAEALHEDYEIHTLLEQWGTDVLAQDRVQALLSALKPI